MRRSTKLMFGFILSLFLFVFMPLTVTLTSAPRGFAGRDVNPISRNDKFSFDKLGIRVHENQAFAQAASPAPAEVAPVAAPTYLDGILKFLAGSSGLVTGIVIVAELVMRLFPTKDPKSLLLPLSYAVSGLSTILSWLSSLLTQLSNVAQNSQNKS